MMNSFVEKLILLFSNVIHLPVYWLSLIVPKDKNLWLFGSWLGKKYGDNSKYLFEYVKQDHPEITAVWLTTDPQTRIILKARGFRVCHPYWFTGYWLSMRAAVGVVSIGIYDLNRYACGGIQLIQLWHGTPLKKILYDDNLMGKQGTFFRKLFMFFFPYDKLDVYHDRNLITASSEAGRAILSSAFGVAPEKIAITGYPRNDSFFSSPDQKASLTGYLEDLKRKGITCGIYMPTHRSEGKAGFSQMLFEELKKIGSILEKNKMMLFVKMHYYHLAELGTAKLSVPGIHIIREEEIDQDIYSVLSQMQFLITDYSSIFFDYLLTDKPIIFVPFDKETYMKRERNFYYNYDEITPGPKAYNWNDALERILESVTHPEKYSEERKRIREMFNKYADGRNSARVVEAIAKAIHNPLLIKK